MDQEELLERLGPFRLALKHCFASPTGAQAAGKTRLPRIRG
jgi:hypothetical protein